MMWVLNTYESSKKHKTSLNTNKHIHITWCNTTMFGVTWPVLDDTYMYMFLLQRYPIHMYIGISKRFLECYYVNGNLYLTCAPDVVGWCVHHRHRTCPSNVVTAREDKESATVRAAGSMVPRWRHGRGPGPITRWGCWGRVDCTVSLGIPPWAKRRPATIPNLKQPFLLRWCELHRDVKGIDGKPRGWR